MAPPRKIHGLTLYHCPRFNCYLLPERCEAERRLARGKYKRRRKKCLLRGKTTLTSDDMAMFEVAVKQRQERCLSCPGAKALAEGQA